MLGFDGNPGFLIRTTPKSSGGPSVFFKNLDPPCKTSILLLFARIALIFDMLGVESSSNMKLNANAKLEDALASKFLPSVSLGF